ncbi:unknow [Vibrio campbellii]|nr:unknow [Vibrio campbellii]
MARLPTFFLFLFSLFTPSHQSKNASKHITTPQNVTGVMDYLFA